MKKIIAVTYENGEIFQHFGHTENFKVYTTEEGKVLSSEIMNTNGEGHSLLAEFLNVAGVSVLICGGIGGGARNALAAKGIEIIPGVQGKADEAVEKYLKGTLLFDPEAKCNHHHDHGDGEHHCGEHDHGEGHHCSNHDHNCHE